MSRKGVDLREMLLNFVVDVVVLNTPLATGNFKNLENLRREFAISHKFSNLTNLLNLPNLTIQPPPKKNIRPTLEGGADIINQ